MKELHVITDLQYGSTGKGLFAGYLAEKLQPDTIVTAWGPNAGHTYIDRDDRKFVNIALPNGIVSQRLKHVMLGPGSIINPALLMSEMEAYADLLDGVDIVIHEHAAVVQERHREEEAAYGGKIGSTMKGVGAAVIEKIRRNPDSGGIVARDVLKGTPLEGCLVDANTYNRMLDVAGCVLLEGAQGFSLSLNQGFYPYCTSRDCTTMQLLSDCGIPFGNHVSWRGHIMVYGVARTFPIRVNNRTGWSGPNYPDQEEITWESIGLKPELTTVTKLPRRIFTFSMEQLRDAVRMNGVQRLFLNFVNYLDPEVWSLVKKIEPVVKVQWLGWGPRVTDIQEI